MWKLVEKQQEEYSKVVHGCGEYKHLEVDYTVWVGMTPEQRKVKIEQVMKQVLKASSLSAPCKKTSTQLLDCVLNGAVYTSSFYRWRKAENILSNPNFVLPAAGNASARQVASISNDTCSKNMILPYLVNSKKSASGVKFTVIAQCSVAHLIYVSILWQELKIWVSKVSTLSG